MSGLLALLDDVAAIAKVAAASIDDVAGQAAKAGAKAAGAVIDDTAVAPAYVTGFSAQRELPIVGRIALGSIRNKMLVLLPLALVLSAFAPWAISPLLMLGGGYLCFEGAEKVWHALRGGGHASHATGASGDPAHLEEEKVAGAIKTDFILSAEIMTIALAALPAGNLWMEAASLALVAVGITAMVYGSVALIVKADDIGLALWQKGRLRPTRAFGRMLVEGMPAFLRLLTTVGTAAMLWVGGAIVLHGLADLGYPAPAHAVEAAGTVVGHVFAGWLAATAEWLVAASIEAVVGLALGVVLLPVGNRILAPLWRRLTGSTPGNGGH